VCVRGRLESSLLFLHSYAVGAARVRNLGALGGGSVHATPYGLRRLEVGRSVLRAETALDGGRVNFTPISGDHLVRLEDSRGRDTLDGD